MVTYTLFLCLLWGSVYGSQRKEVVVVGGGMAGMAAARQLLKSGQFDVKVFEGRMDRYGGRIWTNRKAQKGLRGVDVELGPMFLNTKVTDNPLLKLVEQFQLETTNSGSIQLMFPEQTEGKNILTGDNATNLYVEAFKIVLSAVERIRKKGKDGFLFEEIMTQYDMDKENIQDKEERELVLEVLQSLPVVHLTNFSTLLYNPEIDFGWDSILVDGQDTFLDRIVSGEGMEMPIKIQLNKLVKNIKVDNKRGKVLVRTADRKQAIVDAVVVAVPIGVLKEKSIIFEPALPVSWYKAVRNIGLGYSTKVIARFDKAFWPKDVGSFLVSSSVAGPGFLQMWTNAYRLSGNPVLIGNIFGDQALHWEQAPVKKLKEKVIQILSDMFGSEVVSSHKLTLLVRSDWSTDTFTKGSVSYPKVGNQPSMWKALQSPFCPYIFFAGAHTESGQHVDSVHGAYISGVRAAEQIINNVCKKQDGSSNSKGAKSGKTNKKASNKNGGSKKKDEL